MDCFHVWRVEQQDACNCFFSDGASTAIRVSEWPQGSLHHQGSQRGGRYDVGSGLPSQLSKRPSGRCLLASGLLRGLFAAGDRFSLFRHETRVERVGRLGG